MRAEIPEMLKRGGGAIVNTASMAGVRFAEAANAAYAAAKAGVIYMTENAAARYSRQGIRVNCVAPGLTHTAVIDKLFTPEQQKQMAAGFHLIERMVEPSEIADAVIFLASERAAMITGVMLPVAGGQQAK
jgi:NAD(P)-dependent dehydrogenase (short-subunit alcohol dehydrogenase family)